MSDKIEEKVQEALNRHNRGYNCSQSVACTFCEELGIDEATMFRMTEEVWMEPAEPSVPPPFCQV